MRFPAFASGGIALNDVDPGVEATIRWRDVVNNGVAAGEALVVNAQCEYDGERVDLIASNPLKVRATPAFANAIAGLPFGLDGMIGPASASHARSLTERHFLELPPATPVSSSNGTELALEAGHIRTGWRRARRFAGRKRLGPHRNRVIVIARKRRAPAAFSRAGPKFDGW